MKKLPSPERCGSGSGLNAALRPPYRITAPSSNCSSVAAVELRYSSTSTPTSTEGRMPIAAAPTARQSICWNLPGSAQALLASVTRLTTAATVATGASPSPLVAPITIMPRPKPVTVWK
ncbi:hypothetical protein D3C72_2007360 [compost metagenome]